LISEENSRVNSPLGPLTVMLFPSCLISTPAVKTIHGTTRANFNNMVVGVSEGFQKALELIGVGYTSFPSMFILISEENSRVNSPLGPLTVMLFPSCLISQRS
jgi:hypothetical protein